MTFAQELDKMFIGREDMLRPQDRKMLNKLATYPAISRFALLGVFFIVGGAMFLEIILGAFLHDGFSIGSVSVVFVAILILFIIWVITRAQTQTKLRSPEYRAVAALAIKTVSEASSDELMGLKMTPDRREFFAEMTSNPWFLCDFYHINRRQNPERLLILLTVLVLAFAYIPRFATVQANNDARVANVIATQERIQELYSDICQDIDATDPHEYRSDEYTIHMGVMEGYDTVAGYTLYVNLDGQITDSYYTARFNAARTPEENIELVNGYYTQFYEKLNELSDIVAEPEMLDYNYQIEGKFASEVKKCYKTNGDVNVDGKVPM
ncbi:MAG: hypothetical protein KBS66_06190 [Eubacterium sp.]|nr:hypothetical protein [Candidatus Colimonas fimequi]